MKVSRDGKVLQTHNGANIPLSGASVSIGFIDCLGYSNISGSVKTDAAHSWRLKLQWSYDGTTIFETNHVVVTGTTADGGFNPIGIRAPYVKIALLNDDTGAAHVMSAWVYLTT